MLEALGNYVPAAPAELEHTAAVDKILKTLRPMMKLAPFFNITVVKDQSTKMIPDTFLLAPVIQNFCHALKFSTDSTFEVGTSGATLKVRMHFASDGRHIGLLHRPSGAQEENSRLRAARLLAHETVTCYRFKLKPSPSRTQLQHYPGVARESISRDGCLWVTDRPIRQRMAMCDFEVLAQVS